MYGVKIMRKKVIMIIPVVVLIVFSFLIFASRRHKGIDGLWLLEEEFDYLGDRISGSDLKFHGVIYEKYVIKGTDVTYSCKIEGAGDPIVYDLVLEELGDNRYNFNYPDNETFITVKIEGNTMTYSIGQDKNCYTLVFRRQNL